MQETIDKIIRDGRTAGFRFVRGRYIATAIPLGFEGGPVPNAWRAEAATLEDAMYALGQTFLDIPNDAQWGEDGELQWKAVV